MIKDQATLEETYLTEEVSPLVEIVDVEPTKLNAPKPSWLEHQLIKYLLPTLKS